MDFYEKRKEQYKVDSQFWPTNKKVIDAYMPSFQEFKDIDLKKFPEAVQKAYLLTETTIMSEEQTELHGDLQKQMVNNFAKAREERNK